MVMAVGSSNTSQIVARIMRVPQLLVGGFLFLVGIIVGAYYFNQAAYWNNYISQCENAFVCLGSSNIPTYQGYANSDTNYGYVGVAILVIGLLIGLWGFMMMRKTQVATAQSPSPAAAPMGEVQTVMNEAERDAKKAAVLAEKEAKLVMGKVENELHRGQQQPGAGASSAATGQGFCPACGKPIVDANATFCRNCGAKLSS